MIDSAIIGIIGAGLFVFMYTQEKESPLKAIWLFTAYALLIVAFLNQYALVSTVTTSYPTFNATLNATVTQSTTTYNYALTGYDNPIAWGIGLEFIGITLIVLLYARVKDWIKHKANK